MQVNNNFNPNVFYDFAGTSERTVSNEYRAFSDAVTKSEEPDEGEFLGLTMLPEKGKNSVYGMRAMLSSKSTPDNPIVQVISNLDGKRESYDIEINKIDPAKASGMEMFALCCYEDKYGTGTGSTFGSFHTLRMYEETAAQNGYGNRVEEDVSVWDRFMNGKTDWIKLTDFVLDALKSVKDPKAIDLYLKGRRLRDFCAKRQETRPETKVTEIGVASLPNGISFYFNEDTGEVSCVNDKDDRPGRQVLWSKNLTSEEMERCDRLFENYKDEAAGHFVFRYSAYLEREEFWDRYLAGKIDLATLKY